MKLFLFYLFTVIAMVLSAQNHEFISSDKYPFGRLNPNASEQINFL